MENERQSKKRITSKPDRQFTHIDRGQKKQTQQLASHKKVAPSPTALKTSRSQTKPHISPPPPTTESRSLTNLIHSFVSSCNLLKPYLSLKTCEAKQTYKQYRAFKEQVEAYLKGSLDSVGEDQSPRLRSLTHNHSLTPLCDQILQNTSKSSGQTIAFSPCDVGTLQRQLQELNVLHEGALYREGILNQSVQLQKMESYKFRQLLKLTFPHEQIQAYNSLISQFKEAHLSQKDNEKEIQTKIKSQEDHLKELLQQQRTEKEVFIQELKRADNTVSDLRLMIEGMKVQTKVKEKAIKQLQTEVEGKRSEIESVTERLKMLEQFLQSHNADERNQLLQHISQQESQIANFSVLMTKSEKTTHFLQHQVSELNTELDNCQSLLCTWKENYQKLDQKSTHMLAMLTSQEQEIQHLLEKYTSRTEEVDTLNQQARTFRDQIRKLIEDNSLRVAEWSQLKEVFEDAQVECHRERRKAQKLQILLDEKEGMVRDSYIEIMSLKKKLEEPTSHQKSPFLQSKKSLFEDLKQLVNGVVSSTEQLDQERVFRVPLPPFIEMQSDNISLCISNQISLEMCSQPVQPPSHESVLKELSAMEVTSLHRFQKFLDNFGSDRRIQSIKRLVCSQFDLNQEWPNPMSGETRLISGIEVEGRQTILGEADSDLLGLM